MSVFLYNWQYWGEDIHNTSGRELSLIADWNKYKNSR